MTTPTTQAEYEARFAKNQTVSGRGFDTTVHVPCPFCGAADFMVHRMLDVETAYAKGAVCKECKRGMRARVARNGQAVKMWFVQTEGSDPPPWVPITRDPDAPPQVVADSLMLVPGAAPIAAALIDQALPRMVAPQLAKSQCETACGIAETIHGTELGKHTEIKPNGQQADYLVLTAQERAKGFVEPVRKTYLHEKCGGTTTMSLELAETYARCPDFYSGTFCASCGDHFPVGENGEFVWKGTPQKVGTRAKTLPSA